MWKFAFLLLLCLSTPAFAQKTGAGNTFGAAGGSGSANPDLALRTVTAASVSAVFSDDVILCNATSNAQTINLIPAASACVGGRCRALYIKKIDTTVNAVTIDANSSETIDDQLTRVLAVAEEGVILVSDGTNWHVVGVF